MPLYFFRISNGRYAVASEPPILALIAVRN